MLPRARVVWPTLIGGLALLDWWADRGEPNGDTISELTRELFAVHTRVSTHAQVWPPTAPGTQVPTRRVATSVKVLGCKAKGAGMTSSLPPTQPNDNGDAMSTHETVAPTKEAPVANAAPMTRRTYRLLSRNWSKRQAKQSQQQLGKTTTSGGGGTSRGRARTSNGGITIARDKR